MKESKFFIDTNIFLRAFIHDLPKQAVESLKFLDKVSSGKYEAFTSTLVLSEFAWTLRSYYHLSKEEVVTALQALQGVHNLKVLDHQNMGLGIDLYANHSVKYTDALIASAPEIQNGEWSIVSYDKDFDSLGCKRFEPSEF
ncbi:MAG: PIN domain-containing protein [Candidatus Gracilibacteria bacterium]